jgi:hypothetical protein
MILQAAHGPTGQLTAEKAAERSYVGRDGHLIVVKDDNELFIQMTRHIERFKRHAGGHRAIPDYRDRPSILFGDIFGKGHAQGGRDRSG